ncbi:MAG: glucose-6-phosphate dehydrogenase [Candidatus Limnocylindrales bacterium]
MAAKRPGSPAKATAGAAKGTAKAPAATAGVAKGAAATARPARAPAATAATPPAPPSEDEAGHDQPIPAQPAPRSKDAPRTMKALRTSRVGKRPSRAKPAENVLREGLRLERVPDPSLLVLFGATGDLAHRKVIPALYQLWRTNLLPHEFMVLAIGRRDYDDDAFRTEIRASLEQFSRVLPLEEPVWRSFSERICYHRLDFADPTGFDRLAERLDDLDLQQGTHGNRLFYLATQPSQFAEIVGQLGRVGLDHERHDGGWRRIVIEKPFGHDLESAKKLNREVGRVFRESQVYRIDHYLGKETVRNLLVFRFGNGIFEPLWNRRYVDHVQITVAESIGIESRGAFYEQTGASRDVVQNHLLQLVSLVAMEPPATFEADALRDEKVKVLRAIRPPEDPAAEVIRGQYGPGWVAATQVPGYRQEPEVDPTSETETFVAARFTIDDWRWSGVPFYVRTGKRLPKRSTEIAIQFREVPHRLFRDAATDPDPNLLAIRIQPDEGIMLRFGAKVPGLGLNVRSVTMDFTYGSAFSVDSPDAYETLILDALQGDASLFTRADEVEEAWSIVDPIVESWATAPSPPFPNYDAGTWGPAAADDLMTREGRRWRRI